MCVSTKTPKITENFAVMPACDAGTMSPSLKGPSLLLTHGETADIPIIVLSHDSCAVTR